MKIYAKDILKKYAQNPLDPNKKLKPVREPVKESPEKEPIETSNSEKETNVSESNTDKTVRDLSNELINTYFNDEKITEISHKLQLIIQGILFGEKDEHTFSDKMTELFSDWLNATTSIKANLLAIDILSTPRIPPTVPTLQTQQKGVISDIKPKIDVVKI